MRQPREDDRVARFNAREGRRVFEQFGFAVEVSNDDIVRVHWTATRANGELSADDSFGTVSTRNVIGEWEGHYTDGDTCWCVPRIEHGETGDIIIHQDETEAS